MDLLLFIGSATWIGLGACLRLLLPALPFMVLFRIGSCCCAATLDPKCDGRLSELLDPEEGGDPPLLWLEELDPV